jgi:hypothetical protein
MISDRWLRVALGTVVLVLAAMAFRPADAQDPKPTDTPKPTAGAVEARFTDNSTLKLFLVEAKINLTTPYGKLSIPVGDIQTIDFATRIPEDIVKKVEKAIVDLGSTEFKTREAAKTELLKYGERAYLALLEATKSNDTEVKRSAETIISTIKQNIPAEALKVRKNDVVTTADNKFTGQIDTGTFKVTTTQFGEQTLKLADVRSLRNLATKAASTSNVKIEPDPGSPTAVAGQIGMVYYYRVTGIANGALWGSDVYTSDSSIATAAVHSGILKPGETGIVKVLIVLTPNMFEGTSRNGVNSRPYGQYPGAYMVEKYDPDN